jgi:hypothetical protein
VRYVAYVQLDQVHHQQAGPAGADVVVVDSP